MDVQDQGLGLPVAIKDLPAGTLMIGGDGRPLSPQEVLRESHQLTASTPKEFQEGNILRAGWRYTSRPGNEITEIILGRPFGAKAPFDSIQICALFVHNERVLAVDRFSRVTGVEERVDTEAPVLDEKNWFEIQFRVLVNGFPELWDRDLYTAH